jgi:hypothetical protein
MSWCPRTLVLGVLLAVLVPVSAAALPADAPAPQARPGRQVLGYYGPGDPNSWTSLQANAQHVDLVAGHWLSVDACGNLTTRDDQTLKQFARDHNLQVLPSLFTVSGWLNHRLLTDEAVAARAIEQIVDYVSAEDYEGFDLDLEAVEPGDALELCELIEEHHLRTLSPVAARVLAEFDRLRERFVKVMPRDYKRVLREQAEAAEPQAAPDRHPRTLRA